ncbi:hypothetical protein HC928_02680 [bacterium]|nr:hypothetical protein [bacterium]
MTYQYEKKTYEAYLLLLNLIEAHQHKIEPRLWTGAMIGALAENYKESLHSFWQFKIDLVSAIEHYKSEVWGIKE